MAVREREVNQLGLSLARHVVRVDLRRLGVAVAHPLLQSPQRHLPGGGHLRRERVPQIVQPDRPDVGADERCLEVLEQPRVIEWTTCMRMRQDEVAVAVPRRRAVVLLELLDQARGERDSAHGPPGLRGAELSAHVRPVDPELQRAPVKVRPAQGSQLALAALRASPLRLRVSLDSVRDGLNYIALTAHHLDLPPGVDLTDMRPAFLAIEVRKKDSTAAPNAAEG